MTATNLHPFPQRVGIAIDLNQLRGLMRQFITETTGSDYNGQQLRFDLGLRFETFLQWAANRQKEATNEQGTD